MTQGAFFLIRREIFFDILCIDKFLSLPIKTLFSASNYLHFCGNPQFSFSLEITAHGFSTSRKKSTNKFFLEQKVFKLFGHQTGFGAFLLVTVIGTTQSIPFTYQPSFLKHEYKK